MSLKSISEIKFRRFGVAFDKRFPSLSLPQQLLHGGMSGFAIRMSAYKTVNKRADLKRNFAASLACSGYTGGRSNGESQGEGREIEAGFGEAGETDVRAKWRDAGEGRGQNESGNRGNERNRREKIRAQGGRGRRRRQRKERPRKREEIDERGRGRGRRIRESKRAA